ncbi:type IV secretion protein Rhs, partial [Pseudomonas fluorescens]|uniref:RHS repeat-associated core domain-containing protein n=1 Tax=Pseudomonas fluorescens TaxID=294 RepID=UPI0005DBB7CD
GSLQHHYDELGNLIQTQLPDGRWVNRLYYGSGHLHQINLDGQVISDFERDRLHREVLRTQGQISTRSEYDRSGRLRTRQRRHSSQPSLLPAAVQKHFEYDPADNLIGKLDQQPAAQQRQLLHYDATGRIIANQDSLHGQRETFTYDAAANLLDGPAPGAGLVVHNKLLTYQDKRYRYDAFGRMIEKRSAKRGVQHFAYDAESRLIEVRNDNGSVVKMTYDPLGRRIEKTEHDSNGYPLGETRFTWDGLRLLQEHRHQQTSLYLYEDDGYEPLARVDGSGPLQKIRYYHNDLNGLPEQLTEADGHNVWQATYRVWGNTLEEVREAYYIEEQNLRFQGQYLDRETGLHFNTFRFYDPDVGRFTTPDPIGLKGGLNLYQYAPNPTGWADPWGWAFAGVDFTGSSDLFPTTGSQKNIVTIKMQGARGRDFTQAFKEAGISKKAAKDYTWHHVDDFNPKTGTTTMQLVKTTAHEATFPHGGSVAQYEKHFKVKYESTESVLAASKKGWLANKIPKAKAGRCS